MILVDTNIIIGFWRHPDENTAHIFATEDIAICGVVKAEILHGAHSLEDCKRILAALADFPCLDMRPADWEILGRNLYLLRSHGITVPFQDAVIATMAISNHTRLWTIDKHFAMIKTMLPELEIYGMSDRNSQNS